MEGGGQESPMAEPPTPCLLLKALDVHPDTFAKREFRISGPQEDFIPLLCDSDLLRGEAL